MDAIVQAAGSALVQAMATDTWQQVKHGLTGLWRRARPGHVHQIEDELDELRRQVLQARADSDHGTEQALEGAWRLRLQEFLRLNPALAADLRQFLDQELTPALPEAGQTRIAAILMAGTSRDSSTFTQIGTQINYRQP